MATTTAKPKKFPRKLRQKLEKVAQARDERKEREANADTKRELSKANDPLWMRFIWEKSAEFMYMKGDPDAFYRGEPHMELSITLNTTLPKPLDRIRHIYSLPPWLRKETPPAE